MSSPKVLYHKIHQQMKTLWPEEHDARRKRLSWLLVGLFLGGCVQLSFIARKLPGKAQKTSMVTNFGRLLNNERLAVRRLYQAIIKPIIAKIVAKQRTVTLIIDGSKVGNGHQLLMIAIATRKRAIPLIWTWRKGVKGHSPVKVQLALFKAARALIPTTATVIVTGDSEFGAVGLLTQLEQWGWYYALRQKGNHLLSQDGGTSWQSCAQLLTKAGQKVWLTDVLFTQKHAHPCHFLALWKKGEDKPWLLATNLLSLPATRRAYRRRMWIEALFGDCKGSGFDLERTRLKTPAALSRLVLAVAFLVVWLLAFGSQIVKNGQRYLVDRTDRRDLSLFRIGWDSLERRLANEKPFSIRLLPYF